VWKQVSQFFAVFVAHPQFFVTHVTFRPPFEISAVLFQALACDQNRAA